MYGTLILRMRYILLLTFVAFNHRSPAQNLDGQWRGSFTDMSASKQASTPPTEYILEFSSHGTNITGSSYTYYYENGKKVYSICTIAGTLNRQKKTLVIKETKRIKTNQPGNETGFQKHTLYYTENKNEQMLQGKWEDAKIYSGTKHWGYTKLSKKQLIPSPQIANLIAIKENKKNKDADLPAKAKQESNRLKRAESNRTKVEENEEPTSFISCNNNKIIDVTPPAEISSPFFLSENYYRNFGQRKNDLLQIIATDNSTIKIDLYDNGEIDGDSISLYYNNKLLLSHARLGDKPITIMLEVENNSNVTNELIMYAENLGTIPPNTALMVITDGTKRYELRITSDLEKSGSVRFLRTRE